MPPSRRSCLIIAVVGLAVAGIGWSAKTIVPKVLDDRAWNRAVEASLARQYPKSSQSSGNSAAVRLAPDPRRSAG